MICRGCSSVVIPTPKHRRGDVSSPAHTAPARVILEQDDFPRDSSFTLENDNEGNRRGEGSRATRPIVAQRTNSKPPPWGRWHGTAVTEGVAHSLKESITHCHSEQDSARTGLLGTLAKNLRYHRVINKVP